MIHPPPFNSDRWSRTQRQREEDSPPKTATPWRRSGRKWGGSDSESWRTRTTSSDEGRKRIGTGAGADATDGASTFNTTSQNRRPSSVGNAESSPTKCTPDVLQAAYQAPNNHKTDTLPEVSDTVESTVPIGFTPAPTVGAYYLEDGDLFVLVEHTIFCIHSHFVCVHSPTMAGLIANQYAGTTATRPMKLSLVSPTEFVDLLWVFYDETLTHCTSPSRWLSILLSAEKLDMARVIDLAMSNLDNFPTLGTCDPFTVIKAGAGRRPLPRWAQDAYLNLCQRSAPLSQEEAPKLGPHLLLLVTRGREASLRALINGADQRKAMLDILSQSDHLGRPPVNPSTLPSAIGMGLYPIDVTGGNIILRAGQLTFKIHLYFLITHSPMLAKELERTDASRSSTVFLENVDAIHLSWLLSLFYDSAFNRSFNSQQWIAILDVATKLGMSKIGELAVQHLDDILAPVDALYYARQLSLSGSWVDEAMEAMIYRKTPPTAEEASRLGFDLLTKICSEREGKLNRIIESERKHYHELALTAGRPCHCSVCRRI